MCGRYYSDQETFELLKTIVSEDECESEETDLYPSQQIPVIIYQDKQLKLVKMSWGYQTSQALIINARSETLLEKKIFREDALCHRCLIPSKGFYEWDVNKHKLSFEPQNEKLFLMAGIYREKQKEVVMITTKANHTMKPIHSRMPLMIHQSDMLDWLTSHKRLEELLHSSFDEIDIVSGNLQQSLF